MTICPKCGGTTIFDARDDAPTGVKDWVRCLCGKRWDPTKQAAPAVASDVMATITRAFDEWQPEEESERAARLDEDEEIKRELPDGDDDLDVTDLDPAEEAESPTAMAMKDVRVKRERPAKEKTMSGKWTDEQRAKFKATMAAKRGEQPAPKDRTEKRRGRPPKVSKEQQSESSVPAVAKPKRNESVSDTTVIDVAILPARGVVSNGALSALDAAITSAHEDVAALKRAREILVRHSA